MNLFGVMDISASALKAERVRAEVVAANMANAETTKTADGGPYRRQHVVFAEAGGSSFGSQLMGFGAGNGAGWGGCRGGRRGWRGAADEVRSGASGCGGGWVCGLSGY